ncbi:Rapid alkalinization factor 23 [Capsicum annuum]|uniref:Rapid alkalinization factor 23 n=1 Tax=Capsicum annuum TaxID=4072 RepID=A0A1U8DUE7_CAPAN|nr:rapid alkalinization factor [Capsicum annuum]KAF3614137.1 Rapid alkalinization factor 23 [Capsicum annuum]KAF3659951.1 Rapid alkalinization factor 23 [Capsicum annuum]PHT79267.1 Rapid alkalinization factor 23 [Capsicum annuum]
MGVPSCLVIFLLVGAAFLASMAAAGESGTYDWMMPVRSGECKGSIAECMAEEEEFELDSESNRRILATKKYISYGALQKNSVPCSRRGASYYNCKPGAQANPYSRGCSAITRCRG